MLGVWRCGQHGVMPGGMEAQHDLGAGWFFHAQPLRPDGHPSVGADLEGRAHAPDKVPPRAAGRGPQERTVFLSGLVPGPLRGLAQFAVEFMGVVLRAQVCDVAVATAISVIFSLAK